jgi:hypothetical protein
MLVYAKEEKTVEAVFKQSTSVISGHVIKREEVVVT